MIKTKTENQSCAIQARLPNITKMWDHKTEQVQITESSMKS